MNLEKIIGFVLVGMGVAIILYSLYASYMIFTGAKAAPELFEAPAESAESTKTVSPEDIQGQIEDVFKEQLGSILPPDTLPKTLNLFAWSILTGILIFGSSQLAGIGVKLVKK